MDTSETVMTIEPNATLLTMAHADWLRNKAANFRRLAVGAIPFAVAQDIERLAARYERLAAGLEDGGEDRVSCPAVDAAD
jgi:hypothetical protein